MPHYVGCTTYLSLCVSLGFWLRGSQIILKDLRNTLTLHAILHETHILSIRCLAEKFWKVREQSWLLLNNNNIKLTDMIPRKNSCFLTYILMYINGLYYIYNLIMLVSSLEDLRYLINHLLISLFKHTFTVQLTIASATSSGLDENKWSNKWMRINEVMNEWE